MLGLTSHLAFKPKSYTLTYQTSRLLCWAKVHQTYVYVYKKYASWFHLSYVDNTKEIFWLAGSYHELIWSQTTEQIICIYPALDKSAEWCGDPSYCIIIIAAAGL